MELYEHSFLLRSAGDLTLGYLKKSRLSIGVQSDLPDDSNG